MKHSILAVALFLVLQEGCPPGKPPIDPGRQRNAVRLQARTFTPAPGLAKQLERYFQVHAQRKAVHVLIQFVAVPGAEERALLRREMNIRLLDPVPERSFFASIPPQMAVARSLLNQERRARWIGVIASGDKVEPRLTRVGIPEHAKLPKEAVTLVVQFFGDVSAVEQERVLKAHQANILTRVEPLNGWVIVLAERGLPRLAEEDVVKWITASPGPPEDDNDGVRSVTGVGSDLVLPPIEYALTGNGVIVAQWESTHASGTHADITGRIVVGDPPVPVTERSYAHDESVTVNGQYDNGEAIYRDLDDSGSVSNGDLRVTAAGGFPAGSTVAAGDPDDTSALVLFDQFFPAPFELFADTGVADGLYTPGEGIYLDSVAPFSSVTAGDTRLTPVGAFPAGSVVSAGPPPDADLGQALRVLDANPHYHATHVAGTVLGNGSQSAAQGGTANQWMGVAPSATLRSYNAGPFIGAGEQGEYVDAAINGVSLSTNSWGNWYRGHCHQTEFPDTCYDVGSEYYDAVISGRRSDGTASGLARQILIFGSSGNSGRPERHTEEVVANGQYDNGESIYWDRNDDGVVSGGDTLLLGAGQPVGAALVNFNPGEMHDETVSSLGTYNNGEGIYLDADASRTISPGDTRILAVGAGAGFGDGSAVVAGDPDDGTNLRQFRLWGNVRIPNSAKGTIEVANISSDANTLSASSSRGPTDDGRVKPDLAGPGTQNGGDGGVTSTWPGNGYDTISGTSMSTPAVAGGAALLEEWYQNSCVVGGARPDTLKALLIHGAEDLVNIPNVAGSFDGPDPAFGYGRTRVKEAVDLVPHHITGTAAAVGDTNFTVLIGAMESLKVTLAWNDPPWTANAAPSAATGILQNDLDLLVIAPDGTQHTPWVLDASNPFAPATRAAIAAGSPVPLANRDRRNPVEQVLVDTPTPGTWTIRVTASTLNIPPQNYTLVSEVLAPEDSPCTSLPGADVWMRDNPTDTGAVPSAGSMWLGPDLWNRLIEDGLTTHENPEFGQENYLYANIRNALAVDVSATSIDIWAGSAALGLVWPDSFTYVGRFSVPNLGPSEVRQVGPLPWYPPSPTPSNHYCLYMRVASPQDPITFAETSSVWTNAMNSNNIAYRNIIVVDLASRKTTTVLLRNPIKKEADVDVILRIPDELLRTGEVHLELSRALEDRWPEQYRRIEGLIPDTSRRRARLSVKEQRDSNEQEPLEMPPGLYRIAAREVRLRGIRMLPHQAEELRLTFGSRLRNKATYRVNVVEQIDGKIVGGILFVVRTGQGHD